ncbi:MAG TPA: hypothetical protein DGG95_13315 [Cytophagales bacterium]|nr:hypothetical protein [Cytophagales bacterium]
MRNLKELKLDMDSVNRETNGQKLGLYNLQPTFFNFHFKRDSVRMPKELVKFSRYRDSIAEAKKKDTSVHIPHTMPFSTAHFQGLKIKVPKTIQEKDKKIADSLYQAKRSVTEIATALSRARMVKNQLQSNNANLDNYAHEYRVFQIQWHKILANSIACIAMFLIGAPLGAIIKKGGLGVPVLASILFFILFYVLSLTGDKWALAETVPVVVGTWMANAVLFSVGFVFLRQARADARLFDADFYNVVIDKLKTRWRRTFGLKPKAA